jgi:hypothetical protein
MSHIGIIGSGIAGLHLGLGLQQLGIETTIYSEWTPAQTLGRRLPNMVARNACTRERERQLGVNHWDAPSHDMERLSMSIRGTRPLTFSGRMAGSAQAVDMRIYWARLLDDFSSRGGDVSFRTVQADQLEALASQHDLLVVASGRANLSSGSILGDRVELRADGRLPERDGPQAELLSNTDVAIGAWTPRPAASIVVEAVARRAKGLNRRRPARRLSWQRISAEPHHQCVWHRANGD